jgi:leucyl/phenylalanyl-tRNA--protein transferase
MSPVRIPRLPEHSPGHFPPANRALRDPDGLLACGGGLGPDWLIPAYCQGIFPWFIPGEPIFWWAPKIRYGFLPGGVHLGRGRRRKLRSKDWSIRADTAFGDVIRACAEVQRAGQSGTWIGDEMIAAYSQLHAMGIGHSVEVFEGEALIGGLYGLALGRVFFAESMFSHASQASAAALFALSEILLAWQWSWIDAQMENPHLALLGGQRMDRTDYLELLVRDASETGAAGLWTAHFPRRKITDYLAKTRLA